MAEENLDRLPPEERIKKLKELEKKRQKEIEEAKKKIKESESELTERRKWFEKVPIPQVSQDDLTGLSAEGKEILAAHKGIKVKKKDDEDDEDSEESVEKKVEKIENDVVDLESLARESVDISPEFMQSEYAQYLSQQPMGDIYNEIKDINHTVEEKGYISAEEERKVGYLASAVEKKVEDAEAGKYSFNEDVAMAASLTRRIGSKLRGMYQSSGVGYKS
ncbi:hypothetical protein HON71_02320 [Candidatus Woesearchaeota archaeon]|mgnify:CR=1 FL=1|jgi:hypothetical protein|nr:hypothetical protein [Candidatus Woesearchaeota archaeon]MBT5342794.1 hypothetical protein [Candidatus Woesearchaeota archaeon]